MNRNPQQYLYRGTRAAHRHDLNRSPRSASSASTTAGARTRPWSTARRLPIWRGSRLEEATGRRPPNQDHWMTASTSTTTTSTTRSRRSARSLRGRTTRTRARVLLRNDWGIVHRRQRCGIDRSSIPAVLRYKYHTTVPLPSCRRIFVIHEAQTRCATSQTSARRVDSSPNLNARITA